MRAIRLAELPRYLCKLNAALMHIVSRRVLLAISEINYVDPSDAYYIMIEEETLGDMRKEGQSSIFIGEVPYVIENLHLEDEATGEYEVVERGYGPLYLHLCVLAKYKAYKYSSQEMYDPLRVYLALYDEETSSIVDNFEVDFIQNRSLDGEWWKIHSTRTEWGILIDQDISNFRIKKANLIHAAEHLIHYTKLIPFTVKHYVR